MVRGVAFAAVDACGDGVDLVYRIIPSQLDGLDWDTWHPCYMQLAFSPNNADRNSNEVAALMHNIVYSCPPSVPLIVQILRAYRNLYMQGNQQNALHVTPIRPLLAAPELLRVTFHLSGISRREEARHDF